MLSLAAHRTQPLKKTREGGSLYSKLPVKKTHGFFLRVPFAVIFSFAYLSRSLEKKRAYKRKDNNSFPFEACVPSSCWPPVVSYAFSLRLYPLKKNEHTKEKITTLFPMNFGRCCRHACRQSLTWMSAGVAYPTSTSCLVAGCLWTATVAALTPGLLEITRSISPSSIRRPRSFTCKAASIACLSIDSWD